jgi:hypothetical protein
LLRNIVLTKLIEKNMKRILFYVFTLAMIISVNDLNAELSDKKLDKKYQKELTKVIQGKAMIRLKKDRSSIKSANGILGISELSSAKPLLNQEQRIDRRIRSKDNRIMKRNIDLESIRKAEEPLLRTFFVEYSGDENPFEFCQRMMKENPDIEITEPVYRNELHYVPNDPLASQQTVLSTIKAFQVWDQFEGDTSVVIGISDNGVLQTHEDLYPNIAPNWGEIPENGFDDDNNGYIDDYIGYNMTWEKDNGEPGNTYHSISHGVEVAGIAAAKTNNMLGLAGVANKCRFFPIKTSAAGDRDITMGYQSIIYAAIRGVDVLNCSWGNTKNPLEIEQSIIDYAVANDVAIVASAGNEGNSRETVYPAGYKNVLGVGEVTQLDVLSNTSSLGVQLDVMASGQENFSTTNYGAYHMVSGGTSFAAPVVSGFLAMIRSIYPELNAVEAMEFARQCTDDISALTAHYGKIIPGRINLQKALELNPNEIPSIAIEDVEYRNTSGEVIQGFQQDDIVDIRLLVHNYLGAAENLTVELSIGFGDSEAISIIKSKVNVVNIPSHSDLTIGDFRIKINKESKEKILLRFDIYNEDRSYEDFRLWQFTPTTEVTTFRNNDVFAFSVGDRGTLGYGGSLNNQEGVGIAYKDYGSAVYEAGLLATESVTKLVSANWGDGPDYNDFSAIQPFINTNEGICRDMLPYPDNKIGLDIRQVVQIAEESPYGYIDVHVMNTSGSILQDVAAGYFFDWDIGLDSDSNSIAYFPEAIPDFFAEFPVTAMIARYTSDPDFPVFGCGVIAYDQDFQVQGAGMSYDQWSESLAFRITTLNSGTSISFNGVDDVNCVVGMKFPGTFNEDDERSFRLVFAAADNEQDLAMFMQDAFTDIISVDEDEYDDDPINVYPNPARDHIKIDLQNGIFGNANISLKSMIDGREILNSMAINNSQTTLTLDTKSIPAGIYLLQIETQYNIFTEKVIIIK